MDDRYNYEDSFLTREEKRNRVYNYVINKYNKSQTKALKIVFPIIGVIYFFVGFILLFVDEETLIPGIVFVCLGLVFALIGLLCAKFYKPKQYSPEEIEKRIKKTSYAGGSMNSIYHSYYMQDARIILLEDEIKELRDKIEELERKLR